MFVVEGHSGFYMSLKGKFSPSQEFTSNHPQILRHPPPQTLNPLQNPRLPLHNPPLRVPLHPLRFHAPRPILPPPRLLLRRLLERSLRRPRLNPHLHRSPEPTLPHPSLPPLPHRHPKSRYPSNATMAPSHRLAILYATGSALLFRRG